MSEFFPRNVLLGVSGSIAAYKAALVTRELVKAGAQVQVVMTPAAHGFVTPLTLATLSGRPVLTEFVDRSGDGTWNDHVELARWADVFLVAPASANTIAKMVQGICDNLLMACFLSIPNRSEDRPTPVYIAPAMDLEMFKDESTTLNLLKLKERGIQQVGPEDGDLASGLSGVGRMSEPAAIVQRLMADLQGDSPWRGKKVLITAGPTREPIDPVRFIGNRSTGKMGFALAEEAAARGANVQLIAGPVSLKTRSASINRTNVETAAEMMAACKNEFSDVDVVIMAAAVADMRPARKAEQKIKKSGAPDALQLERTEDILAWMGTERREGQTLIGFALETENGEEYALGKLERKNLDMIVMNTLADEGAGFAHNTNLVTLIDRHKNVERSPLMTKEKIAGLILDTASKLI